MRNVLKEVFREPPTLYTDRLILRKMKKSDANDMFKYASSEETTRYLLWNPHTTKNFTLKYLTIVCQKYKNGEFFDWAIEYQGRMIGTCGFAKFDLKNNWGEIGYVIAGDMQGQGFATEAAECVLRFGFEKLGLHRICARYMVENEASRRVMEKLGMSFEGIQKDAIYIRGNYVSVGTYGKINEN